MGSRRRGGKGRHSPPPWKIIFVGAFFATFFTLLGAFFTMWRPFCYFFLHVGAFSHLFFSMWGGLFCPYGVPFLGLPPPCEKFFERPCVEYDIMFNGDKSKLLLFKGRSSVMMPSEIMVNGQTVGVSETNSSFRSYCIDDGS